VTAVLKAVSLAAVALLLLAACATRTNDKPTGDTSLPGFTPGQVVTEQGRAAADLYLPVFLIAVAVFVLVEGLIILIAIRYRKGKQDAALPPQTHGNNVLEIVWTVIPALIVTGMFVASMAVLFRIDARAAQPGVTVDVTGFQWQWNFEYPDQGLSYTGAGRDGPEMVLPVNEPVLVRLHAQDVIHSFYVPAFFYKKDAIPGRVNEFEVNITTPGTYGGQCAEFCGLSHSDMYFTVRAVARAEFDSWVAAEQQKAQATSAPAPTGAPSVELTAVGVVDGFDPKTLAWPAGEPVVVVLHNADTTAPHDFGIKDGFDFNGEPNADPGQTATYTVPPMEPGTYTFFCTIHPNMTGTLNVGPAGPPPPGGPPGSPEP
jgi:cytochrome c oxidase subunit 2